jgi:DNA-binding LytR/AlgR family response regulator
MINIVAIDDEKLPLELVQLFCEKTEGVKLVHAFNILEEAKTYIENNNINIVLLDIEMPNQNGLEFYASLNVKPVLIICTAYPQYALDGFQSNAIDYLLKPFSLDRFQAAITKAKTFLIGNSQSDSLEAQIIRVKSNYGIIQITVSEIAYIESFADFVQVHYDNFTTEKIRITMIAFLDKLPAKKFLRVHRSFIVCISKVKSLRNNIITIADIIIPVGRTYSDQVISSIKNKI